MRSASSVLCVRCFLYPSTPQINFLLVKLDSILHPIIFFDPKVLPHLDLSCLAYLVLVLKNHPRSTSAFVPLPSLFVIPPSVLLSSSLSLPHFFLSYFTKDVNITILYHYIDTIIVSYRTV